MFWANFFFWLHCLYVLGVLVPIPLIILGGIRGWRWVYNPIFRRIHLAMIGIVVFEQIIQLDCPLTILEAAFDPGLGGRYDQGWLRYWAGRLLFPDWPSWIFSVVHFGIGALIAALYFAVRPQSHSPGNAA